MAAVAATAEVQDMTCLESLVWSLYIFYLLMFILDPLNVSTVALFHDNVDVLTPTTCSPQTQAKFLLYILYTKYFLDLATSTTTTTSGDELMKNGGHAEVFICNIHLLL